MKGKKKGLTLVELIAVMGISTILGLIIMSLMLSQNKMFLHVTNESIAQGEARLTFSSMEDHIKIGKNKVELNDSEVSDVTIDSVNYSIPEYEGLTSGKVVYACTELYKYTHPDTGVEVKRNLPCVYVYYKLEGKETGTLVLAKDRDNSGDLSIDTVLSKGVTKADISESGGIYTINLALKKGDATEDFRCIASSRN